jgi:hypothetical protein
MEEGLYGADERKGRCAVVRRGGAADGEEGQRPCRGVHIGTEWGGGMVETDILGVEATIHGRDGAGYKVWVKKILGEKSRTKKAEIF